MTGAVEEGIILPGAGGGRGLIYNLRVQEALAPPPVVLGSDTPLEEALLRLCADKSEVVVVVEGGRREGGSSSWLGWRC